MTTSNDIFWQHYADAVKELKGVQTVDEVIEICSRHFGEGSGAEILADGSAFFPGGSGDTEIISILLDAGWSPAWERAHYYFGIRQPDGKDGLHYVEGDIYRGVGKPI